MKRNIKSLTAFEIHARAVRIVFTSWTPTSIGIEAHFRAVRQDLAAGDRVFQLVLARIKGR